jgi:hypothetical protein
LAFRLFSFAGRLPSYRRDFPLLGKNLFSQVESRYFAVFLLRPDAFAILSESVGP